MTVSDWLWRLALPVALGVGMLVAWAVSAQLGDVTVPSADVGQRVETLETAMGSVRRLPALATTSFRGQRIELAIGSIPGASSPLACAVVIVDGQVVHDEAGSLPLAPGPAQLLSTGFAALEVLGPEYRYETRIMAANLPQGGGVDRLYLVGGGDPVLMSSAYRASMDPPPQMHTSWDSLLTRVDVAELRWIGSAVVGVNRRYDDRRVIAGRAPGGSIAAGADQLSALQLDDGVATDGRLDGVGTVPTPGGEASPGPATDASTATTALTPAEDPALLAAQRLAEDLAERGVEVYGLRRVVDDTDDLGDLLTLASVESPPLRDIVAQMLTTNDLGAAELIVKELGFQTRGEGSTIAGAETVAQAVAALGADSGRPPPDGSGLAPGHTTTCTELASLASAIPSDASVFDAWPSHDAPHVFGGNLDDVTLESDLRVVGGAVGDVSALVARSVGDGPQLTMVSIVNRAGGWAAEDVDFQRALVVVADDLRAAFAEVVVDESLGTG